MKKNKINFYNEEVYYEKIDNGLEVYIVPNNSVNDVFVTFTTKYGGCNYPFYINNKYMEVPNGIAHFLEHKMFEQKNGMDPFTFYNKSGTYCNAFTNYFNTSYLFAGGDNFDENLNYLLDYVQEPYFTDESVEKEKGIIEQELKMYDDMPDNIIYERTIYNLFNNHPIKYPVGGTVSDIMKITKEELYNCYKTFYNPKNMFIIITGNVDAKHTIDLIKENQKTKSFEEINIKLKEIKEDDRVSLEKEIIKHNVATPYISYGVKIPVKSFSKIDKKKRNLYLSSIFNILFDETSIFYERMKEEDLLDTPIDIDTLDTDEHKVFMFTFKSNNYEKVINEIDNVLKNIDISKEDLERKKKVNISNLLYTFDDISRTNKLLLNDKIMYDDIHTNIYDILKSMNKEEMNEIISKLDISNKSILIIENQDE